MSEANEKIVLGLFQKRTGCGHKSATAQPITARKKAWRVDCTPCDASGKYSNEFIERETA